MLPPHTAYKLKLVDDKYILRIVDTRMWSQIKSVFLNKKNTTLLNFNTFEELLISANEYRDKKYIVLFFLNEKVFEHIDINVQFTTCSLAPTRLILS